MRKTIYPYNLVLSYICFLCFISCQKDNIEKTDNYFNVTFSVDTIANISGEPIITYTAFDVIPVFDSVQMISFSYVNYNYSDLDGGWRLSIYIPKTQIPEDRLYYLNEFDMQPYMNIESCFIDFEIFYNIGVDHVSSYSFNSCYTKNQSGYFELYNISDTSVGIKFIDLKLTNNFDKIVASSSCDLVINLK